MQLDGVLILNKPSGISSREAGEKVKKILKVRKIGHAGTLDPMARGVLPLLLGQASKLSQFLTGLDKTYIFKMKLGERTLTGDATGEVVERKPVPPLDENYVREVVKSFEGPIMQSPHPFSAVKYRGKPLYKYAREGNLIKLEPREVEIKEIEVIHIGEEEIDIKVTTSSGVYVRTLAEDIGEKLGTVAHLVYLNRLQVGRFSLNEALTMEEVEELAESGEIDRKILSMVEALDMKKVKVGRSVALLVSRGVPVSQILGPRFEVVEPGEKFAIISENGKVLYAIAEKNSAGKFRYVRVFPDQLK